MLSLVVKNHPAFPDRKGKVGAEGFLLCAFFQLPSADNNLYVEVACFGIACSASLYIYICLVFH